MKRCLIFLFCVVLFVPSCSNNEPPENLIKEDKYINLMIELQLLRTYQAQSGLDSTTVDSLMNRLFQKYDVTSKQFKKSHQYYQNNIQKQSQRIEHMIERLRKDRVLTPDTTTKADSTDSPEKTGAGRKRQAS